MKSRTFVLFAVVVLPAFALQGCGGGANGAAPAYDEKGKKLFQGDLAELVQAIETHERAEDCDRKDYEIRKEIVMALAEHESEINEYMTRPSGASPYEPVAFKSITFRKLKKPYERITKQGFVDDRISWRALYNDYLLGRDNPSPKFWASINNQARGIIVNDEERVIKGFGFSYGPNSGKGIRILDEEVKACEQEASCTHIKFTPESQETLKSHPVIQRLVHKVNSATNATEARNRIAELRTETYYGGRATYMLHPYYDGVKRIDSNTYEVQMSVGDIRDAEAVAFVQKQIESTWSDQTHKVKVVFDRVVNASFQVMKLVFGSTVGERSFVNRKHATLNLFNASRTTTISHEFGHVLGFQDMYYTLWEPDLCSWNYPIDESNIMGDHETGGLFQEHWDDLNDMYPMPGTDVVRAEFIERRR